MVFAMNLSAVTYHFVLVGTSMEGHGYISGHCNLKETWWKSSLASQTDLFGYKSFLATDAKRVVFRSVCMQGWQKPLDSLLAFASIVFASRFLRDCWYCDKVAQEAALFGWPPVGVLALWIVNACWRAIESALLCQGTWCTRLGTQRLLIWWSLWSHEMIHRPVRTPDLRSCLPPWAVTTFQTIERCNRRNRKCDGISSRNTHEKACKHR